MQWTMSFCSSLKGLCKKYLQVFRGIFQNFINIEIIRNRNFDPFLFFDIWYNSSFFIDWEFSPSVYTFTQFATFSMQQSFISWILSSKNFWVFWYANLELGLEKNISLSFLYCLQSNIVGREQLYSWLFHFGDSHGPPLR